MNEKIHRIIDLCLELEDEVTHATCYLHTHVNAINVVVWEGEELTDETKICDGHAYYDGECNGEQKINDIIQELEELLQEQKSWEG